MSTAVADLVKAISAGEEFTVRLGDPARDAPRLLVCMVDRVLPDRTCGQYEAGWWVRDASDPENEENDMFLSEAGILYRLSEETGNCDEACGYQAILALDAMLTPDSGREGT